MIEPPAMTVYGLFVNQSGYHIMKCEDGRCQVVACVGGDGALAAWLRDALNNRARIDQLLERHGLVDVPLSQVEDPTWSGNLSSH